MALHDAGAVAGHVVTVVELAEPLSAQAGSEVEVLTRLEKPGGRGKLSEILRSFPPGKRSKEDIDRQVREDRDSW